MMVTLEYASLSSTDLELMGRWKLRILKTAVFHVLFCWFSRSSFQENVTPSKFCLNSETCHVASLLEREEFPVPPSNGSTTLPWLRPHPLGPPYTYSHGPTGLLFLITGLLGQGKQRVCVLRSRWGLWLGMESWAITRWGGNRSGKAVKWNAV